MLRNPPENIYDYDTYWDAPDGKRYNWDPDFQCWNEVMTKEQYDALSHWEKYAWLYASLLTMIVSIYFVL